MRLAAFALFIIASTARADSFTCRTQDGEIVVNIRDGGPVASSFSQSAVDVREGAVTSTFHICEQRPGRIYDQDIIGVVCEDEGDLEGIYVGIFTPELDGFIEFGDHRSFDIQCER